MRNRYAADAQDSIPRRVAYISSSLAWVYTTVVSGLACRANRWARKRSRVARDAAAPLVAEERGRGVAVRNGALTPLDQFMQRDLSVRGSSNRPGARSERDRFAGPSRERLFEFPSQRGAAISVKRCNVGRGGACASE